MLLQLRKNTQRNNLCHYGKILRPSLDTGVPNVGFQCSRIVMCKHCQVLVVQKITFDTELFDTNSNFAIAGLRQQLLDKFFIFTSL